jgi:hypothetical protein
LQQIQAGVQASVHGEASDSPPSDFSLGVRAVRSSVGGSLLGGAVGLMVDQAYCERHHGDEPSVLFGPCFLYVNEGFGAGWFGGAIVGSTIGAVRAAEKRGCPRPSAILRGALGAIVGSAPGLRIVASRPGKYPPSRSIFIASAPLLSGIGAAVAVAGCHSATRISQEGPVMT